MELEPTAVIALAMLGLGRQDSMQLAAIGSKSSHVVSRLLEESSNCRGRIRLCSFLIL